jgi:uncharacterized repeat protein (TIGR01451 family)
MTGSSGTQIGGNMAGEGNVLGGNGYGVNTQGIVMDLATSTTIQGNFIGTDPTGTHVTGPFEIGVTVVRATGTTIGGTGPGEGNVIANDSSAGHGGAGNSIFFSGAPPVADVLIEGNSLYGNDGPAILSSGIAAPILTGATSTTITGHIVGNPGSTYRVEYFATPNTGGASNMQGKTLIGFQTGLVADASGNVPLSFNPVGGVPAGEFITATATKDGASTSGLGTGILTSGTTASADMGVAVGVKPNPVAAGAALTFTITVTNGGPDAATQATMATAVPTGTTFVSLASPAGWAANSPAVGGTGPISASIASLAAGGQAVFSLIVKVDPTAAAGSTIALTSNVSTTATDPNPGNNSAGDSSRVSNMLVATQTVLSSSPNPAAFGQLVTLTATVTAGTGGTPAGNVTFLDGSTTLKTVALDQLGHATFSTSDLGAGSHMITAIYGGNETFAGSQSSVSQVVQPASGLGPKVTLLQRFGFHRMPTIIVLTFNAPLEAASAQDLKNYQIKGPSGHLIGIKSVAYDPGLQTVTIRPSKRLSLFHTYHLVVNGSTATGVRGADGVLLDGAGTGMPGTDYRADIDHSTLVLTPAHATKSAHHRRGPLARHHVAAIVKLHRH